MTLDDRNCSRGNGPKRGASARRCIITVQRQRLAMNLQLLLTIGGIEVRCAREPVEKGLMLRLERRRRKQIQAAASERKLRCETFVSCNLLRREIANACRGRALQRQF